MINNFFKNEKWFGLSVDRYEESWSGVELVDTVSKLQDLDFYYVA